MMGKFVMVASEVNAVIVRCGSTDRGHEPAQSHAEPSSCTSVPGREAVKPLAHRIHEWTLRIRSGDAVAVVGQAIGGLPVAFARAAAWTVIVSFAACTAADRELRSQGQVRVVQAGAVYVGEGGQFSGLRGLDSLGIEAVLDLDREHAVKALGTVSRDWGIAREHGMRFVHLPLHPDRPPSLEELDWAVRVLEDRSTQPILVHVDGDDRRARMVIAAYRVRVQGWSPERALEEMTQESIRGSGSVKWRERLLEYADARSSSRPSDEHAR